MFNRHPTIIAGTIALLFGLVFSFAGSSVGAEKAQETEQLIVFSQGDISPVGVTFRMDRLPEIRSLAEQMQVSVHIVDVRNGSPQEVAVTPLIVYQNHRGRSVYQGRTTTPARLRNFIRTSRFIPQVKAANRRENIPILHTGRVRIWAPLKITRLSGTVPGSFNHETFEATSHNSIVSGFLKFKLRDQVELGRADRGFYMDFYPHLSEDGKLFISLALFSQFDCKKPVFVSKVQGPWSDRTRVFRRSAAVLEKAVLDIARNPQSGDSFDPVPETNPLKSWQSIGFPLPPQPPKKKGRMPSTAEIPKRWVYIKPGPLDPPMIQFRFPAPLDGYAGEVKHASGDFSLSGTLGLDGATGFIEVDTNSAVTMGNAVLDEVIRGSMMLDAKNHPKATFDITAVVTSAQKIAYGKLFPAVIRGDFTLKGKSIRLTCPAEFELVIGDDHAPSLLIRTAFKIDLRTFGIEGADGPTPEKYTLLFDVNFLLKARKT